MYYWFPRLYGATIFYLKAPRVSYSFLFYMTASNLMQFININNGSRLQNYQYITFPTVACLLFIFFLSQLDTFTYDMAYTFIFLQEIYWFYGIRLFSLCHNSSWCAYSERWWKEVTLVFFMYSAQPYFLSYFKILHRQFFLFQLCFLRCVPYLIVLFLVFLLCVYQCRKKWRMITNFTVSVLFGY